MDNTKNAQEYEIAFLVKENDSASEAEGIIGGGGAKVVSSNDLGARQLAYPVGELTRAKYFAIIFELNPEGLAEIEKKLRLAKSVVRYLLVKNPSRFIRVAKRPKSPAPAKKEPAKTAKEEIATPPAAEKPKKKEAAAKPETTKAKIKTATPARKPSAKKTVSSGELDKKLKELTGD